MSEPTETAPEHTTENPEQRCLRCDSVVPVGAKQCLMCGTEVDSALADQPSILQPRQEEISETHQDSEVRGLAASQPVVVSVMREHQSQVTFWFTAIFGVIIIVMGALVLRFQSPAVGVALLPSGTPLPPTITHTPTMLPVTTKTVLANEDPTVAATPAPTETPRPPKLHVVNPGDTLIGLALRYRVSVESISTLNGFDPDTPIQVQQNLEIPWPTATPPLVAVAVTVRGVNIVADPTNCDWYEVRGGDSISSIANKHDVDFELLMLVNRMSQDTILFQGDSLCIPEIKIGGFLPPTPGPSPTPSVTPPPAGPKLLYPIAHSIIESSERVVTLQWTAVKDLQETEWYMVELSNLDDVDALPFRDFTRDSSLQLPESWRPPTQEMQLIRWRVSIVSVTGQRSDGKFIYGYGGEVSEPSFFFWKGGSSEQSIATPSTADATP